MTRTRSAIAALLAASAAAASAAIPLMTKEELRAEATHVVTGRGTVVYARESATKDWRRAKGVVEIAVATVEKGDGIEPGDAVYPRFWTERWVGQGNPPPHGSGHDVPAEGDRVRAHLVRKDGGYEALLPNGIGPLPKPGAEAKP